MDLIGIEVGVLEHHLGSVGEGELFESECLVGALAHDAAFCRQCAHEGFLFHVVNVSLEFLGPHAIDHLFHLCGGVVLLSFHILHECYGHEVGVGLADEFLCNLVDDINGEHRGHLFEQFIFLFDGRGGLAVDEVLHVLVAEKIGSCFLAVVVCLLQLTENFRPCTVVLRGGETEVLHPFGLTDGSG